MLTTEDTAATEDCTENRMWEPQMDANGRAKLLLSRRVVARVALSPFCRCCSSGVSENAVSACP